MIVNDCLVVHRGSREVLVRLRPGEPEGPFALTSVPGDRLLEIKLDGCQAYDWLVFDARLSHERAVKVLVRARLWANTICPCPSW